MSIENKMVGNVRFFKTDYSDLKFKCQTAFCSDMQFKSKIILTSNIVYGDVVVLPPVIEHKRLYIIDTTLEEKLPIMSFYNTNTLSVFDNSCVCIKCEDINKLLNKNIKLMSAELTLNEITKSDNKYELYTADSKWDEQNISWFTKPNRDEKISESSRCGKSISLDLVEYYKNIQKNNLDDNGFILKGEYNKVSSLSSNEGLERPYIDIEYIDMDKQVSFNSFDFKVNLLKRCNSDNEFEYNMQYPHGFRNTNDKVFFCNIIKKDMNFKYAIQKFSEQKFSYKSFVNGEAYKRFAFNFIKRDNSFNLKLSKSNDCKFNCEIYNTKKSDLSFISKIYHTKHSQIEFESSFAYNSISNFEMGLIKVNNSDNEFNFKLLQPQKAFSCNLKKESSNKFKVSLVKLSNSDNVFKSSLLVPSQSDNKFKYKRALNNDCKFTCNLIINTFNDELFKMNLIKSSEDSKEFDLQLSKLSDNSFKVKLLKTSEKAFRYQMRRDDESLFHVKRSISSDKDFSLNLNMLGMSYKKFESEILRNDFRQFKCHLNKLNDFKFEYEIELSRIGRASDMLFECELDNKKFKGYVYMI